jgi:hypothetical protein
MLEEEEKKKNWPQHIIKIFSLQHAISFSRQSPEEILRNGRNASTKSWRPHCISPYNKNQVLELNFMNQQTSNQTERQKQAIRRRIGDNITRNLKNTNIT